MRTELTAHTYDRFRNRFGRLHDAVIYQITCSLFQNVRPRSYTIVFHMGAPVIEAIPKNPPTWCDFTLTIEDVSHYIFKQAPNYIASILTGAVIGFYDDFVYLDFFPTDFQYDSVDNFHAAFDSQRSVRCMVVGKRCYWEEQEREKA